MRILLQRLLVTMTIIQTNVFPANETWHLTYMWRNASFAVVSAVETIVFHKFNFLRQISDLGC